DVDGTDQTSLGQFSGRVQQTYKHYVPRFFVPEHGTMFTLALVRFPPTATKEIQYLNAKGALTYTDIVKWLETNNLFNNLIQRNQSAAFSSGKVRPNHETNINIIARRTGKDVNSHTVLDGIITTIMATIQRINIIGS